MFRRVARWGALVPLVVILVMPEVAHAAAAKPTTTVSIVNGSVAPGGAGITVKYDCFPTGYGPYGSFGDVRVSQATGVTGGAFFRPICWSAWLVPVTSRPERRPSTPWPSTGGSG